MLFSSTIFQTLGIPLLITIAIEGSIIFLLGQKSTKLILVIIIINIITNPLMNIALIYVPYMLQLKSLLLLEITVIIIEAIILYLYLRNIKKAFLFSCIANIASYLVGIAIIPLIY